jgi:hypothetical protein
LALLHRYAEMLLGVLCTIRMRYAGHALALTVIAAMCTLACDLD